MTQERRLEIIKDFGKNENDTGNVSLRKKKRGTNKQGRRKEEERK